MPFPENQVASSRPHARDRAELNRTNTGCVLLPGMLLCFVLSWRTVSSNDPYCIHVCKRSRDQSAHEICTGHRQTSLTLASPTERNSREFAFVEPSQFLRENA